MLQFTSLLLFIPPLSLPLPLSISLPPSLSSFNFSFAHTLYHTHFLYYFTGKSILAASVPKAHSFSSYFTNIITTNPLTSYSSPPITTIPFP